MAGTEGDSAALINSRGRSMENFLGTAQPLISPLSSHFLLISFTFSAGEGCGVCKGFEHQQNLINTIEASESEHEYEPITLIDRY